MTSETVMAVDRRGILRSGALLGISLTIPFRVAAAAKTGAFEPNAFLTIAQDGAVTLALPKSEMGQGVYTSLAILAADELEVDPANVKVVLPEGDSARFGKLSQDTGGSSSIRETWEPLRQAGADARAALVNAAARLWNVVPDQCQAKAAHVHAPGGQVLPYGELVALAAAAPVPVNTPLKTAASYGAIGKPLRRLDAPDKVRGTALFGIDVVRPDMKVAALAQSPTLGGTLVSIDEKAAMAIRGMRQVVRMTDAVAAVADHYWAAKKGLEALAPVWDEGPNAQLDQERIRQGLAAAAEQTGVAAIDKIDAGSLSSGDGAGMTRIAAVYEQPYLAHAPMEPANCVVHVTRESCEIWCGTQVPGAARDEVAKATGRPAEQVIVHNCLMGGGFGRKLENDIILRAVQVGQQVASPVKLIWSREEDMQHDLYRPSYRDAIEATLDANGMPVRWHHRIAGSSIMARLYPDSYKGVDKDAVDGSIDPPYTLPTRRVEWVRQESPVPTSWWRGVGGARSAFVVESFIDECAYAAHQDPVAYRRALVTDARALAVLELAATNSGWAAPLSAGRGRGVSLIHLWDSYMALVVEVEKPSEGELKVVRVTAAVDCGQPVNPLGIEAQIEGGIIFGLSAALHGEITIAGGKVEQSNFHDYRVMRMPETPEIAVHIVASKEAVGGLGEPPVAAIMPALANAVFAATGKRIRALPIAKQLLG